MGEAAAAAKETKMDDPGEEADGAVRTDPLDDEERAERLSQLTALIELMRPSVQADGGDLVLVAADVEEGIVEVQLQGACSSCAISASTLQGGVERILTTRLPWVREVRGDVDDSMDLEESAALGSGGYVPRY
jgi:Fe-S cluster biogenesis protein NfuA